jgi:Uma2 family endonuclease
MQGKLLTYSDYARIPDDGKRYEVLEGGLLVTPAPSPLHQMVSFRLQRQLVDHFEPRGLGHVLAAPIDVILSAHDILQPDLVVAPDGQISKRGIEGSPTLAVEILSPSTRRRDRTRKSRRYAALGVAHFWLVDPDARRIECYRAEGGAYTWAVRGEGASRVLLPDWPGLVIDLALLWK